MTAKGALTLRRHAGAMVSSRIFRSRWAALLWAAGIVWTAYDVAEANSPPAQGKADQPAKAQPTDATGSAVSDADMQVLANFLDGG